MDAALPVRMTLYFDLAFAMAIVYWLADKTSKHHIFKYVLVIFGCVTLAPNESGTVWQPINIPSFFQPQAIRAELGVNPNILLLPYDGNTPTMLDQIASGMGFRMAGGGNAIGYIPPAFPQQFAYDLDDGIVTPHFASDLIEYCRKFKVSDVVLSPGTPASLIPAFQSLGWKTKSTGGVIIFKVPD
jgi:hypothetical protein